MRATERAFVSSLMCVLYAAHVVAAAAAVVRGPTTEMLSGHSVRLSAAAYRIWKIARARVSVRVFYFIRMFG